MEDTAPENDLLLSLIPLGFGFALLLYFLIAAPEPEPPPDNALVFGCYATANASPILLNEDGMQILQSDFPRIGFRLERHKMGIALTADAPIKAERSDESYRYAISNRGIGTFLSFYNVVNGKVYGAFEDSELSGFRMLAMDGRYLPYEKVDASNCDTSRLRAINQPTATPAFHPHGTAPVPPRPR